MNPEIVSEWHLSGYGYFNATDRSDEIPDRSDVEDWLLAAAGAGWPELVARAGLVLVIGPDGRYRERLVGGELALPWYDGDGVQVDSPEPSEGEAREVAGRAGMSLHPDRDFPPDPPGEGFRAVLRIDDGDTMISDIVEVVGDSLIRAISVVTDEMYFDRVVARYGRIADGSAGAGR